MVALELRNLSQDEITSRNALGLFVASPAEIVLAQIFTDNTQSAQRYVNTENGNHGPILVAPLRNGDITQGATLILKRINMAATALEVHGADLSDLLPQEIGEYQDGDEMRKRFGANVNLRNRFLLRGFSPNPRQASKEHLLKPVFNRFYIAEPVPPEIDTWIDKLLKPKELEQVQPTAQSR